MLPRSDSVHEGSSRSADCPSKFRGLVRTTLYSITTLLPSPRVTCSLRVSLIPDATSAPLCSHRQAAQRRSPIRSRSLVNAGKAQSRIMDIDWKGMITAHTNPITWWSNASRYRPSTPRILVLFFAPVRYHGRSSWSRRARRSKSGICEKVYGDKAAVDGLNPQCSAAASSGSRTQRSRQDHYH